MASLTGGRGAFMAVSSVLIVAAPAAGLRAILAILAGVLSAATGETGLAAAIGLADRGTAAANGTALPGWRGPSQHGRVASRHAAPEPAWRPRAAPPCGPPKCSSGAGTSGRTRRLAPGRRRSSRRERPQSRPAERGASSFSPSVGPMPRSSGRFRRKGLRPGKSTARSPRAGSSVDRALETWPWPWALCCTVDQTGDDSDDVFCPLRPRRLGRRDARRERRRPCLWPRILPSRPRS